MTRVIRRTLDLLRATLPTTIEVALDLSPDALFVQADETQLHQVVMNLCLNAREAMLEGGRFIVSAASVVVPVASATGSRPVRWVRLSVHDQGPGISRQLQEKIFDPFFSTKERGTGLGLAVVQEIVQGYGGRIEVISQPGQGACFEVWLPLVGTETPSMSRPTDHAPVPQPI